MKIQIRKNQYKKLVKEVFGVDTIEEQGETSGDPSPKSGTSSDGEKKTNATKWESGVTRGPANQIANTKWSDIVGASLKRDKANRLTEQDGDENEPKSDKSDYPGYGVNLTGDESIPPNYNPKEYDTFDQYYKYMWKATKNRNDEDLYPIKPPSLIEFINNRNQQVDNKAILDYLKDPKKFDVRDLNNEKPKVAPKPTYSKDEDRYDFLLEPLDENNTEIVSIKLENKTLTGIQTFKTYWGENVNIDLSKFDVELWLPTDNRSQSFNINGDVVKLKVINKDGQKNEAEYRGAPPESYLKQAFPDYTIRSIKDKTTKKRYNCWITTATVDGIRSSGLNRGGTPIKVTQWVPKIDVGYAYIPKTDGYMKAGTTTETYKLTSNTFYISSEYGRLLKKHYTREKDAYRYKNRNTYSGKNAPEGFDPNRYDEYLYKRKKIEFEIINLLKDLEPHKPLLSKWNSSKKPEHGKIFDILNDISSMKVGLDPQYHSIPDKINNKFTELRTLYESYRSPIGERGVYEFSYGINPEERELYFQKKFEIETHIKETENFLKGVLNIIKVSPYESAQKTEERKKYWKEYHWYYWHYKSLLDNILYGNELENQLNKTKMIFGYDYKKPGIFGKKFDEIWDSGWGMAIQIVGNMALIAASGGIAAAFTGSRFLAYVAPYVADVAFNSLVAAYANDRGNDEETFISIICALVPVAKYGLQIGKVSEEVATSLATKLRNAPPNTLRNAIEFEEFVAGLTSEELYALRELYALPKSRMKNVADQLVKDIEEFHTVTGLLGVKLPKSGIGVKMFFKEMGFEVSIPLVAGLANAYLGFVEDLIPFEMTAEERLDFKKVVQQTIDKIKADNDELKQLKAMSALASLIDDGKLTEDIKNTKDYTQLKTVFVNSLNKKVLEQANLTPEQLKNNIESQEAKEAWKIVISNFNNTSGSSGSNGTSGSSGSNGTSGSSGSNGTSGSSGSIDQK